MANLPVTTANTQSSNAVILSIPAKARLKRELTLLTTDPPPGIAAYLESEDDLSRWKAEISGPEDSPFEDGVFEVRIRIPSRYPMEPPICRFVSEPAPYHPNIDSQGRICLDTLKSPPAGSWSPAVSLPSLLLSLRSLLAEPNPEDGLEAEISNLYKHHPEQWRAEARRRTQLHKSPPARGEKRSTKSNDQDSSKEETIKKPKRDI